MKFSLKSLVLAVTVVALMFATAMVSHQSGFNSGHAEGVRSEKRSQKLLELELIKARKRAGILGTEASTAIPDSKLPE